MKRQKLNIALNLVSLVAGNYLIFEFAFTQTSQRYFAVLGLIFLISSIFGLAAKVPGLFTGIFPTLSELKRSGTKSGPLKKHSMYSALILVALISAQIGLFYQFFDNQEALLLESGKKINGIVYHKEWDRKGKASTEGYYISYYYEVNNKLYYHTKKNDSYKKGDTIEVWYLPENPDNHKLLE